ESLRQARHVEPSGQAYEQVNVVIHDSHREDRGTMAVGNLGKGLSKKRFNLHGDERPPIPSSPSHKCVEQEWHSRADCTDPALEPMTNSPRCVANPRVVKRSVALPGPSGPRRARASARDYCAERGATI